ncbi:MAG: helix-turn-helix domain-containing protein, partial [Streptosporangiaceae bacterium]
MTEGRAPGDRPGAEHVAEPEPQVEVQRGRVVQLHDETGGAHPATVPPARALDRGLTLQELAVAAAVSTSMLSSVERGRKAPTIVVLARIADGLGVPLSELVAPGGGRVIVLLYAFYLDRTGLEHPGREQVIASQPTSWATVIRE